MDDRAMGAMRRLGVALLTAGIVAGSLAATMGPSVLGAPPCRVHNVTQDSFGRSAVRMVERARDGDRLRVRGTCPGPVVIDAAIAIRGKGDGATIHGGRRHRAVRISSGSDAVLRDLIVEAGSASRGGGIMNRGKLRLVRAIVRDNVASNGGGGILSVGHLAMVDSVVRGNHSWYAGGLLIDGRATLRGSVVAANRADDQGDGGGIYNAGTLTLTDSVVARNTVAFGSGGGVSNGGLLRLIESVVRGNRVRLSSDLAPAWGSGGGIENSGTLELVGSRIIRNTSADEGGGIYNWDGAGTVVLDAASSVTGNTPDDCVGTPAC